MEDSEPSVDAGEPGADDDGGRQWDDPVTDLVEPGSPDPENVAFVAIGALATLFVLARVAGLV